MNALRSRGIAVGLVLAMLSSGCYDFELIKPTELPKLNGSFSTSLGRAGNATVVAVRVVDVEREDGTLAQIKGNFDLKVVRTDGREVEFEHPVRVEEDGDDFVVRGGNRGATRISLVDIQHAEVSQLNPGAVVAGTLLGVLAGSLVVGLLYAAGAHSK
jgi:hypothetical protein